jgi:hypothetical protein
LVLQNNGGDDLNLANDGNFSFPVELSDGSAYAVTIVSQPDNQGCSVTNGSGTIAAADVDNVLITCSTETYTIGGNVSGLSGDGLVLQNNGADDLNITADGPFSFTTALQQGSAYAVTIATQPSDQNCTVSNGSGVLNGADVADVTVGCVADELAPKVSVEGPKLLRFSWNDVGADHYRLLKNPDGVSGYSQVGDNITATSVEEEISVHLTDWLNTSYIIQSCDSAQQCSDSESLSATELMLDLIGYLKQPDSDSLTGFGSDLALSQDATTLAIASMSGVHIFVRSGAEWIQQELLAGAWSRDDFFSSSISVSISSNGDTLVVGDPMDSWATTGVNGDQTDESAEYSGAVYVFTRDGDSWSQQAYIKASNTDSEDIFGHAISLSGDGNTLAVAAWSEDSGAVGIDGDQTNNSAKDAGAVYLFVQTADGWQQQAYIKASNCEAHDNFGWDVALSTDGATLAVASREEDSSAVGIDGDEADNSASSAGAVYLFARGEAGWSQQAYIKASNSEESDRFGTSIALSGRGDLLAVGAINESSSAVGIDGDDSDNFAPYSGAVYLFERSLDVWQQAAYIKASNSQTHDAFGARIELSADGNNLAVRASREGSIATGINGDQEDNSAYSPGAVYLFTRSGESWGQQAYVKAINTHQGEPQICSLICPPDNDEFGSGLGLSSDGAVLAIGAYYEASPDSENQHDHSSPGVGAVYLY